MLVSFFFFLSAAESLLLGAYLAAVGSYAGGSLILNLSASRLAVVLFFIGCGLGFAVLGLRSLKTTSRIRQAIERHLKNEAAQWRAFALSLALLGLAYFLLTRQYNAFGNYKLIYQNLEAGLVWMATLAAQSAFLTGVWYFAFFLSSDPQKEIGSTEKELLPLFGLFLGFMALKLALVTRTAYGPIGRGDEMTYFDMADSLYRGFFSVAQSHHYPPLYPLSIMPALVFKGWAYDGIKLLNGLYSSSLVFPVYFIARRFVSARRSLAAAFLSCLIPFHLVFPRRIVSENLFFPLFLWTMAITYVKPAKRTWQLPWDLLNGVMLAVLYLTRYITLAVIPFFLLAWWAKPFDGEASFFKPGWRKVLHFCLMIAAMLAAYSPWLLAGMSEQVQLKLILGFAITARTNPQQLTLPNLLTWVLLYACYFLLVAAPVLHMLLAALFQIDFKRWRDGFGRWIFQILMVMSGFFAAVTRHSWRAYYNAELPKTIMGRYLVVFSVVYFVVAIIAQARFTKSGFRSKWHFMLIAQVIPFGLVFFAYLTIIQGAIVPTDGSLLKALGSVDAFFTEILGGYFLALLFMLYGISNWLMWTGKRHPTLAALVAGLAVYYAIGIPSYYQSLMEYQTYPWLASKIAQLAPKPDPKSGDSQRLTVFLPDGNESKDRAEIYNTLRVRGFNKVRIATNTAEAIASMKTETGYIIQLLESGSNSKIPGTVYSINGRDFTINEVER